MKSSKKDKMSFQLCDFSARDRLDSGPDSIRDTEINVHCRNEDRGIFAVSRASRRSEVVVSL